MGPRSSFCTLVLGLHLYLGPMVIYLYCTLDLRSSFCTSGLRSLICTQGLKSLVFFWTHWSKVTFLKRPVTVTCRYRTHDTGQVTPHRMIETGAFCKAIEPITRWKPRLPYVWYCTGVSCNYCMARNINYDMIIILWWQLLWRGHSWFILTRDLAEWKYGCICWSYIIWDG
jgi:hypothetical protein